MQVTQTNRWLELLGEKEKFGDFLDFIANKQVQSIKIDGMEISFIGIKRIIPSIPQASPIPELTEEQMKKEEETNLYWSSGS